MTVSSLFQVLERQTQSSGNCLPHSEIISMLGPVLRTSWPERREPRKRCHDHTFASVEPEATVTKGDRDDESVPRTIKTTLKPFICMYIRAT